MIEILEAPPLLTVQDAGRFGLRAEGVPIAGAMEGWAFATANLLAGNSPSTAVFEWAVGGGAMRFHRDAHFALTGASAEALLNERPVPGETTCLAKAGDILRVLRLVRGRFLYLAIRGGLDVPVVLGSRSTYLQAAFGGFEGRRLHAGDAVPLGSPGLRAPRPGFAVPIQLRPDYDASRLRVLPGSRAAALPKESWTGLTDETFRVSAASDRMGYRLDGPAFAVRAGAALLSEPTCTGAIQATEEGQLIVLLSDGPTVGGYPVVAVVIGADLPVLVQKTPGAPVRFEPVSLEEAGAARAQRTGALESLRALTVQ